MFKKTRSGTSGSATKKLLLIIVHVFIISLGTSNVVGGGGFTAHPKSVVLVQTGRTAKFEWNYTVDNRLTEFDSFSPRWSFFNASDIEFVIGYENRFKNWKWETRPTCPPRLLYPTVRVNKTSKATLVITDVTKADEGTYGCILVFTASPVSSKVKLVVSVIPQITVEDKDILENGNLTVNCSAIGPPTPNVTWIRSENNKNVTLAFGEQGSAVLKINNIKRHQSGLYDCYAINNPNEQPVKKQANIIVKYPVEVNKSLCVQSVVAYLGEANVILECVAEGVPTPWYKWITPKMDIIDSTEQKYTITEVKKEHFGNWTLNITNGVFSYYYLHRFEVIQGFKNKEKEHLTTGEIVGIGLGVCIGVALIVIVIVIIWKKKHNSGKH